MQKLLCYLIVTTIFILNVNLSAHSEDVDETVESAVWLMRKAKLIDRRGQLNGLRQALRLLEDEELKPLYHDYIQSKVPILQLHGVMGLSEITKNRQLDLALLSEIKDPQTQISLVGAALSSEMLDEEHINQLINWKEANTGIVAILIAHLYSKDKLKDESTLKKLDDSKDILHRHLGALIHMQLGHPQGLKNLHELDSSSDPQKDLVRMRVLQFAMQWKMDKAGPWAMKILNEKAPPIGLARTALRAGLQFKAKGSSAMWRNEYAKSKSDTDRIRLAIHLFTVAKYAEPQLFDILRTAQGEQAEMVRAIGKLGRAIATKTDITQSLLELYRENQSITNTRVFDTIIDLPSEKSVPLLEKFILETPNVKNPDNNRQQRLSLVSIATQQLIEKYKTGPEVVQRLIKSVDSNMRLSMMMGLVKVRKSFAPYTLLEGIELDDTSQSQLALLLKIRHEGTVAKEDVETLSLIIRGGSKMGEDLRVQAAWAYLKLRGKHNQTLAKIIKK